MKRTAAAVLPLALCVLAAEPALAAEPVFTPPMTWGEYDYRGEAASGRYADTWETSVVTPLDGQWLVTATEMYGEGPVVYQWYGTGRGSRFEVNSCDKSGRETTRQVTRARFLQRVASTGFHDFDFTYDAARDAGVFRIRTDFEQLGTCAAAR
ncbi:MAG: hypothetical protein M3P95_11465 [Actinomycetota bacterium]|nr:hypothetical protein [Actinomycetota bacterium]